VAGEGTPFRGVKHLLPDHYPKLRVGQLTVRSYWKAADHLGSDPSYATLCPRVSAISAAGSIAASHASANVQISFLDSFGMPGSTSDNFGEAQYEDGKRCVGIC
jgi:hypothetical protein